MKPRASRMISIAGRSARANQVRREVAALGEESRTAKYPADVPFAPEDVPETGAGCKGRVEAIRKMAARGMAQLPIAVELGITQSAVGQLMKRHRIKKASIAGVKALGS